MPWPHYTTRIMLLASPVIIQANNWCAKAQQAIHAGHETSIVAQLATHYAQANLSAQAAHYAELASECCLEFPDTF